MCLLPFFTHQPEGACAAPSDDHHVSHAERLWVSVWLSLALSGIVGRIHQQALAMCVGAYVGRDITPTRRKSDPSPTLYI